MPPPLKAAETGGRLSGDDMCAYMQDFADKFLEGKIKFGTEVTNICRSEDGTWLVNVVHLRNGAQETLKFSRIVLCTGVSSSPVDQDSAQTKILNRVAVILMSPKNYPSPRRKMLSIVAKCCIPRTFDQSLMIFSRPQNRFPLRRKMAVLSSLWAEGSLPKSELNVIQA